MAVTEPSKPCPSCGAPTPQVFYEATGVPSSSTVLLDNAAEAAAFPRGDIRLAHCRSCGFIFNAAFDPRLTEYSARYEETQGFSPTFNRFQRELAERLIDRHGLAGKTIVEIGCGKGEFLALVSAMGGCHGVGFDPVFDPARVDPETAARVTFVRDLFREGNAGPPADCLCCKMTLEHIPDVGDFLAMVGRTIQPGRRPLVFFQVPDATPILRHVEFWDVYYEHCSYFTPATLAGLFARSGFDVLDVWTGYGGQYLMIEARPSAAPVPPPDPDAGLAALVAGFAAAAREAAAAWRRLFAGWSAAGERVVLWGSGSKAVSFLTTLGSAGAVEGVVDINPYRQGRYMPGIDRPILAPETLSALTPDRVVVMNPVYVEEITAQLRAMGLGPAVVAATAMPAAPQPQEATCAGHDR